MQMGATALHMAVFLEHRGICEAILTCRDIDVNAVDKVHSNMLRTIAVISSHG